MIFDIFFVSEIIMLLASYNFVGDIQIRFEAYILTLWAKPKIKLKIGYRGTRKKVKKGPIKSEHKPHRVPELRSLYHHADFVLRATYHGSHDIVGRDFGGGTALSHEFSDTTLPIM